MRIQSEDFLQHHDAAMRRRRVTGNGRIKRMTILCGQLHHLRHYDTSADFFSLLHIEAEMENISVTDLVVRTFYAQFASIARAGFTLAGDIVVEGN